MSTAEVGLGVAFLEFLQSIGVGFGDVVILIVIFGVGWLINKGKLKLGGNGYVQEKEYRDDRREMKETFSEFKQDFKALRSGVVEIDKRVAGVEAKMEQFRDK